MYIEQIKVSFWHVFFRISGVPSKTFVTGLEKHKLWIIFFSSVFPNQKYKMYINKNNIYQPSSTYQAKPRHSQLFLNTHSVYQYFFFLFISQKDDSVTED